MLQTARATRGMVVAPHSLAAQAGLDVLREGGNAIEAAVAAAAAITVVYPHMNALGGDNFWLISEAGKPPIGIDACGPSAAAATRDWYRAQGCTEVPTRGPLAALTVAGAVAGWQEALSISAAWGGRLPLTRLLADAVHHARAGAPVPHTLAANAAAKRAELTDAPGWTELFAPNDVPLATGERLVMPRLGDVLERLGTAGLDDFYRGELARSVARDLEDLGSPLRLADVEAYRAGRVEPLSLRLKDMRVFNMPPPTQGLASLMILGIFDRLACDRAEGFAHIHGLVEATKQAFLVRDAHIADPAHMSADAKSFLTATALSERARAIEPERAMPWPQPATRGDTVWIGAVDGQGRAVSFIQSIYWEFGSAVVLPETGILWQNRGASFSLQEGTLNALFPGRKPFHTIQPALAAFDDGRVMVYGSMGGEGQPQTQAALFTRYALFGQELQQAITAPRWLLGRTWGARSTELRIEGRANPALIQALRAAGHAVKVVDAFDEVMGHAGALVRHGSGDRSGIIEGAADPRGDGQAAAF